MIRRLLGVTPERINLGLEPRQLKDMGESSEAPRSR